MKNPAQNSVEINTATNRSLCDHVRDGSFRADLYHRLSVYLISIPPLRERGNDVLILAGHFLELNRARLGLRSLRLSVETAEALCRYHQPGNVRELEHVISRAALQAVSRGLDRNDIITLQANLMDLDGLELPPPSATVDTTAAVTAAHDGNTLRHAVDVCQRQAIRSALAANNGHWARAAQQPWLQPKPCPKYPGRPYTSA